MSKDIIYREDAIKAMEQKYQDILRIFKRKVEVGERAIALDMIGCIKSLPSADRPRGEWVYNNEGYVIGNLCEHYDCGQCGKSVPHKTNYCPNCGADMRESN